MIGESKIRLLIADDQEIVRYGLPQPSEGSGSALIGRMPRQSWVRRNDGGSRLFWNRLRWQETWRQQGRRASTNSVSVAVCNGKSLFRTAS